MYRKSDSDDAEAIALATLNMLDKLPDACPNDAYRSLGQLVHRRDNIMKQRTRLVNHAPSSSAPTPAKHGPANTTVKRSATSTLRSSPTT